MKTIIITALVTFVITALWQSYATKKNRKSLQMIIIGMYHEMQDMSYKLGYIDYLDYLNKNKKPEEIEIILANINNAINSLTDEG